MWRGKVGVDKDSTMKVDGSENEGTAQRSRRHKVEAPGTVITIQGCIYINSASIV